MPSPAAAKTRWRHSISASSARRARSASCSSRLVTVPIVCGSRSQVANAAPPLKSMRMNVQAGRVVARREPGDQRAQELGLAGAGGAADQAVRAVADEVQGERRRAPPRRPGWRRRWRPATAGGSWPESGRSKPRSPGSRTRRGQRGAGHDSAPGRRSGPGGGAAPGRPRRRGRPGRRRRRVVRSSGLVPRARGVVAHPDDVVQEAGSCSSVAAMTMPATWAVAAAGWPWAPGSGAARGRAARVPGRPGPR